AGMPPSSRRRRRAPSSSSRRGLADDEQAGPAEACGAVGAEKDRVVADRRRGDDDERVADESVVEAPTALGIVHEEKRRLGEAGADHEFVGLAVPVDNEARPDADQAVAPVSGEPVAIEATVPEVEEAAG